MSAAVRGGKLHSSERCSQTQIIVQHHQSPGYCTTDRRKLVRVEAGLETQRGTFSQLFHVLCLGAWGCHVWSWLGEFSRVVLSCFTTSRLAAFTEVSVITPADSPMPLFTGFFMSNGGQETGHFLEFRSSSAADAVLCRAAGDTALHARSLCFPTPAFHTRNVCIQHIP